MKAAAAAAILAGVLLCGCSVSVSTQTSSSPPVEQTYPPPGTPPAGAASMPAASSASSCAPVGGSGDGPGGAGIIPAQCVTPEVEHCSTLSGQQRLLCAQGILYAIPQTEQQAAVCIQGLGYGPVSSLLQAVRHNTSGDPANVLACRAK